MTAADVLRATFPGIIIGQPNFATPRNGETRWSARREIAPRRTVLTADRIVDPTLPLGAPLRVVGAPEQWKTVSVSVTDGVFRRPKEMKSIRRKMLLALTRGFK